MMFTVHSTFRDIKDNSQKVLPHGLEWDLGGESFMAYVPMPVTTTIVDDDNHQQYLPGQLIPTPIPEDNLSVRKAIVHAHNRWCFAKDLPFRTVHDIETLTVPKHQTDANVDNYNNSNYYVQWKYSSVPPIITVSRLQTVKSVLESDPSAKGEKDPAEVWINGIYSGLLEPSTLDAILAQVSRTPSHNLCVKRSLEDNNNIIRIERRFRGAIRRQQDIFEHVLDNLYAMEDVEILENNERYTTIIGTATLPDWIMGGGESCTETKIADIYCC
jgi:hypothetical protein